jgi:hypothetical protein
MDFLLNLVVTPGEPFDYRFFSNNEMRVLNDPQTIVAKAGPFRWTLSNARGGQATCVTASASIPE